MKNISPIKVWSAREQVVNVLREAIFTKELKAGERLILSELSARLGVSATPIREALQSLEREGLVQIMPHKEAIVVGVDHKYITDYYITRAILESEAAAMACSAQDFSELEMIVDRMCDVISREHYTEYTNLNKQFHECIWKIADNGRMESILKTLFVSSSLAVDSSIKENVLTAHGEHMVIMEAIRGHDSERAKKWMHEHLMRSLRDTLSRYDV